MVFIPGLHANWDKCENIFCKWVLKNMLSSCFHFTLNLISSFPFLFTFIQPYHLQWKYITDEVEHPEARNKGERLENFDWGHLVRTKSKNFCSGKYCKEYCTHFSVFWLSHFSYQIFFKKRVRKKSMHSFSSFLLVWWIFMAVRSKGPLKACQNSFVDRV